MVLLQLYFGGLDLIRRNLGLNFLRRLKILDFQDQKNLKANLVCNAVVKSRT